MLPKWCRSGCSAHERCFTIRRPHGSGRKKEIAGGAVDQMTPTEITSFFARLRGEMEAGTDDWRRQAGVRADLAHQFRHPGVRPWP